MTELPAHIAALLQPDAYAHPVERVELIQTHISYVLMAGEFVYKFKKPLDLGFLNFSTLRRRNYYCRQEVLLNRRLCAETYLGVVPIRHSNGRYQLGGTGHVVDYAVQMRRLPRELMMDRLLTDGSLDPDRIDQLADKIAAFHGASATGPQIERFGSLRAIQRNWRENFEQTREYEGVTLTTDQFRLLEAYVSAYLTRNRALLAKRVEDGRIRDCHGDLRASAVCFTAGICVYDCIEFNRRFRYSDVASEVAFLAMDLDRRGHPALAERFVRRYQQATGDEQLDRLLPFYKCYRAYVRGKVNSFQLREPEIPEQAKLVARAAALQYFELSCHYAATDRPPLLLIMVGLSATGKSALARALGEALDLQVISSDRVRKELAGLAAGEHRFEAYEQGIYSGELTQQTYATMRERARDLLASGQSVILDATFLRRAQRKPAAALAADMGALYFGIELVVDSEVVRQRLLAREHDATAVSDARWETYLAQVEAFEPVAELDTWQHMQVDANQPIADVTAEALRALAQRLKPTPLEAGNRA